MFMLPSGSEIELLLLHFSIRMESISSRFGEVAASNFSSLCSDLRWSTWDRIGARFVTAPKAALTRG